MRMRRAGVALAAMAGVAACASRHPEETGPGSAPATSQAAVPLGDTLRVMVGQVGTVDGGRLSIRFDSAGPDSRCKVGVQCVWAGDIAATLTTSGAAAATLTLHTGLEPRRATVGGYAIELITVNPYPGTEPPNARLAQVAVLRVTRP